MVIGIANFMQRLRELGAPAEAIEFAVEQMMAERQRAVEVEAVAKSEKEALAARRQADADRQWRRRNGLVSRDITGCHTTSQDIQDETGGKDGPQTPKKTTTQQDTPAPPKGGSVPRGTSPSKPARLCPADFQPSEPHYAKAEAAGRERSFVDGISQRMFRWSHSNATRKIAKKSDWSLALHDWIDRVLEEAGPTNRGPPPGQRVAGITAHAIDRLDARRPEPRDEPSLNLDRRALSDRFGDPSGSAARGTPATRYDAEGDGGGEPRSVFDFPQRRAHG